MRRGPATTASTNTNDGSHARRERADDRRSLVRAGRARPPRTHTRGARLAVLGIAGTLLFVFAPFTWLAAVGAVLWGLGASLGFPVGMSAGADEPAHAAGRVA